eukprot:2194715-Rhodomonas_salina.2
MTDKLPIIAGKTETGSASNGPPLKEASETLRNTNVVQELLTGVNSSMFIVSFGVALYLAHSDLRFGAVTVATVAMFVLILSINRFWKMASFWAKTDSKFEPYAYLIATVVLLGAMGYATCMFIVLNPNMNNKTAVVWSGIVADRHAVLQHKSHVHETRGRLILLVSRDRRKVCVQVEPHALHLGACCDVRRRCALHVGVAGR